jgi:hypothetical protein|tara:strand:- start:335 stop:661 length:327 start_codon:yes stop_codon:yes gene_type:complete
MIGVNNMALPSVMVSMVLAENANEFITVKFLTKDDEERTYNGRLNVKKYLAGGERGRKAADVLKAHNLIPMFVGKDGDKPKYKSFFLDRVLAIKAGGRHVFAMGAEIE